MCNEIEEERLERFEATICGTDDPVPLTFHPVEPSCQPATLFSAAYSRDRLEREGIPVEEGETFVMETWRVGRLTEVRLRPHVRRQLTDEEAAEIKRQVDEAFAAWHDDDDEVAW